MDRQKSCGNDGFLEVVKNFHGYKSADSYGVLFVLIHPKKKAENEMERNNAEEKEVPIYFRKSCKSVGSSKNIGITCYVLGIDIE